MTRHSADSQQRFYDFYINTLDWWLISRDVLERAGHRCEYLSAAYDPITEQMENRRCEATTGLEIHHLTYERLGRELLSDLMAVCKRHHKIEDDRRRARQAAEHYERRMDGWAAAKYGEDWPLYHDPDEVAEEFAAFLDRVGDDDT